MKDLINKRIGESLEVIRATRNVCIEETVTLAKILVSTFNAGGKLLICGNGGSAADSQHLAAEFVSSFGVGLRRKSLPAIALTVDSSIMTAISNDFDFELVFSRQIEGLGSPGDALLALSTSGESRNCLLACTKAKEIGMTTLALTRRESTLYKSSNYSIGVPSDNTQHIQEAHIVLYHCIVEIIELENIRGG